MVFSTEDVADQTFGADFDLPDFLEQFLGNHGSQLSLINSLLERRTPPVVHGAETFTRVGVPKHQHINPSSIPMTRLRSLIALAALFLVAAPVKQAAFAQPASADAVPTWRVDPTHSFVGFKVRHLGLSTVTGEFRDYNATVTLDPANPASFRAEAVIQATSVDTENDRRDNHLRSDDFFDAENHPELRFVTKEVRYNGDGEMEIVGDLTMRGTTKEIVLDGEIMGTATMGDSERVGIEAEGRINRFDFGLKFDSVMEAGGFVVGEDVRLVLEIEAIKN